LISFVKNIPVQDFPNLELCIQTNGLMVEQNWHKLGEIQNRVTLMTVTTDAARADTYEKLRRGGRWQDLQRALAWIAEKKRNNGMQLVLRMVAQHDNFSEMLEFYTQARDLGADKVEYGRLLNMQTYGLDEFQHHDVFDPAHPRYPEAMSALDQVRDLPDVFFYGGLT
jgi:MoaA/NifB/PqqE/SkfB family radical SAM enzyme